MENRSGGVERLKFVLNFERREYIVGVADRQVRGVGVIRCSVVRTGSNDIGITLFVMLGKTVSGGFGRCCFEVVEVAVLFLIIGKALTHVI